jgi:hypothetical protein
MATLATVHLHPFRMLPSATLALTSCRDQPVLRRIEGVLIRMRRAQRRAVRIVDAGCGDGAWLVRAAQRAVSLGFVAVECRGFDADCAAINRARGLTDDMHDPRIGLTFHVAGVLDGLKEEESRSADILLCRLSAMRNLSPSAHERASAELSRVAAGALICLGGPQ